MENYDGKICPFCKTEIKEGDEIKVCPSCEIPHHAGCWEENKGCTTFGCSGQNDAVPSAAPSIVCSNCGVQLEEGQLFCPKCGYRVGVPQEVNPSIEEFNKKLTETKKKKKKRLFVVLPIVVCVLIAAIILSYAFYFAPNSKYLEAMDLYDDGKYEEAIEILEDLGGFKDSEEQIKNIKYDMAIELYEKGDYSGAIKILELLDGHSDSKKKITEIKADYLSNAQIAYALIARGYDADEMLASCVYSTLFTNDLYDGYTWSAMSHLYGGTSYRVYYYWSRYSNGYKYVVEYSTAQAFVNVLSMTNENIVLINTAMSRLNNPPEEYKNLYNKLKDLHTKYKDYHDFVKTEPSVSYSTYESRKDTKERSVDAAVSAVKSQNSQITNKVSEYEWD